VVSKKIKQTHATIQALEAQGAWFLAKALRKFLDDLFKAQKKAKG
jgi:hypothetical protein